MLGRHGGVVGPVGPRLGVAAGSLTVRTVRKPVADFRRIPPRGPKKPPGMGRKPGSDKAVDVSTTSPWRPSINNEGASTSGSCPLRRRRWWIEEPIPGALPTPLGAPCPEPSQPHHHGTRIGPDLPSPNRGDIPAHSWHGVTSRPAPRQGGSVNDRASWTGVPLGARNGCVRYGAHTPGRLLEVSSGWGLTLPPM